MKCGSAHMRRPMVHDHMCCWSRRERARSQRETHTFSFCLARESAAAAMKEGQEVRVLLQGKRVGHASSRANTRRRAFAW